VNVRRIRVAFHFERRCNLRRNLRHAGTTHIPVRSINRRSNRVRASDCAPVFKTGVRSIAAFDHTRRTGCSSPFAIVGRVSFRSGGSKGCRFVSALRYCVFQLHGRYLEMILRASTAFLNRVIAAQAAAPSNLSDAIKLFHLHPNTYVGTDNVGRPNWDRHGPNAAANKAAPVAVGTAATAYINPGSRALTGLPNPSAPYSPPIASRGWILNIPSGVPGLEDVVTAIDLNEECAADFAPGTGAAQLGFTSYSPTSGAPLQTVSF
jgi:hypothetical protein